MLLSPGTVVDVAGAATSTMRGVPPPVGTSRRTYLETGEPLFSGGVHLIVSEPSPRLAIVTPLTGPGLVSGRAAVLGPPASPSPTTLVAVTVKK